MYTEFISKNQQRKLKIIDLIITEEFISANKIIRYYLQDSSERKIMSDIASINNELFALAGVTFIQSNKEKQLYIAKNVQSLYSQLLYTYLSDSLSFQVCLFLCTHYSFSMSQICFELNISTSHFYKIIKLLNKISKPYHISFSINKEHVVLIKGKEFNIRVFMFYFLSSTVSPDKWRNEIADDTRLNVALDKLFDRTIPANSWYQLNVIDYILSNRFIQKKFIPHEEKMDTVPLFNFVVFDLIDLKNIFHIKKDDKSLDNELLIFNFLVQIFIPDLLNTSKIERVSNSITNNNLYSVPVSIISKWNKFNHLHLNETQINELNYFMSLAYYIPQYVPLDFWTVWKNRSEFFSQFVALKAKNGGQQAETFILKNFPELSNDENMLTIVPYLAHILIYSSILSQRNPVHVFFSFIKEYTSRAFLKQRLRLIYSEQSVIFVDNESEADIIIIDDFRNSYNDNIKILFKDYFSDIDFSRILSAINTVILKKNNPANKFEK